MATETKADLEQVAHSLDLVGPALGGGMRSLRTDLCTPIAPPPAAFMQTLNLAMWHWCQHGHSSPAFTPLDDGVDTDASVHGPQHFHLDDNHLTHSERPEGSTYAT